MSNEINEILKLLSEANSQIKKLTSTKRDLEDALISTIGHDKDGQSSYEFDDYQVTVKTTNNYTLDKRLYKELLMKDKDLAEKIPVKSEVVYKVDKEAFLNMDSQSIRLAMDFITVKPSKPYVSLKRD